MAILRLMVLTIKGPLKLLNIAGKSVPSYKANMIKHTYLTHVCRQSCSGEKIKYEELSANTVTFISCRHRLTKDSLGLPHPYFPFPFQRHLLTLCYKDVYRHESGRCCSLPFFLTFFISLHFQDFLVYEYYYKRKTWKGKMIKKMKERQ